VSIPQLRARDPRGCLVSLARDSSPRGTTADWAAAVLAAGVFRRGGLVAGVRADVSLSAVLRRRRPPLSHVKLLTISIHIKVPQPSHWCGL
jgi:hypothetical protein